MRSNQIFASGVYKPINNMINWRSLCDFFGYKRGAVSVHCQGSYNSFIYSRQSFKRITTVFDAARKKITHICSSSNLLRWVFVIVILFVFIALFKVFLMHNREAI